MARSGRWQYNHESNFQQTLHGMLEQMSSQLQALDEYGPTVNAREYQRSTGCLKAWGALKHALRYLKEQPTFP